MRLAKEVTPQNTSRSTKWALKTFESWCDAHNVDRGVESVPPNLLTVPDIDQLNKFLSHFVVEARKANGEKYPPATLHQILCNIMREITPDCPKFLNKMDKRFHKLHGTLDAHFHDFGHIMQKFSQWKKTNNFGSWVFVGQTLHKMLHFM